MASNKNMQRNANRGFTLIELLVVVAILGILAVVLVPTYIQYVEKSREAVCRSNRSELLHAYQVEDVMVRVSGGEGIEVSSLSDFVAHHGPGCPSNGVYSVKDGAQEILCSLHDDSQDDGAGSEGETPESPEDSNGNSFKVGSIKKYKGDLYRCLKDTKVEPPNAEFWQKVTPENTPSYTSGNSYSLGDVVTGGNNKYYICIDAEKAKTISPPMGNNAKRNEAWEKIN